MIATIHDDFDLGKIAQSGQCFRWNPVDSGAYRIIQGDRCLYAESLGEGAFRFSCDEDEFKAIWRDYFDLGQSYREIRERIDPATDPFLWQAAEAEKGIRILRQDPWEMLVSFIISQNRNIPAIKRSIELLCELAGPARSDARGRAYRGFPSAEDIAATGEQGLGTCALGYREKYVLAAADAVAKGSFNLTALAGASDKEALEQLTNLYGVGIKVASCMMLFGLHRLDAFPIDVWMKRVLADEYPDGFPFDHYSPYNGVYQQYLFAYCRAIS